MEKIKAWGRALWKDKNKEERRYVILYVATVLFSLLFISVGSRVATRGVPAFTAYASQLVVQATVTEVGEVTTEETVLGGQAYTTTTTVFKAKITEGDYAGTVIEAVHLDDPFIPYYLRPVQKGDNVFLQYAPETGSDVRWTLQEYRRTDGLLWMGLFVVALILLFGRTKGIHTIISLSFTCLAIFTVFVPSILSGQNIYLSTVIIGVYVIGINILLVIGPGQKGLCSAVSCLSGLAAVCAMSLIMDRVLSLTGLVEEDSILLLYLNPDNPIDLRAVIFAAIVLGGLGAIMDVGISTSSSLYEVYTADPTMSWRSIWQSGMTIGRDVIGTMSNTLLLAYIGGSLSLVALLMAYNDSMIVLLNKELIVVEILQALVGIAGLLLVIPLTSLVCAVIFTRKGENEQKGEIK